MSAISVRDLPLGLPLPIHLRIRLFDVQCVHPDHGSGRRSRRKAAYEVRLDVHDALIAAFGRFDFATPLFLYMF